MTGSQLDMFEREIRPAFEEYRTSYLCQARACAAWLARDGAEITVDDVRAACPPPPEIDPRVMGAVFKAPDFVKVGYRRSTRRECHNRPVAVFKLASFAG